MHEKKEPQIFILFLLVSFAALSSVLFTPALPLITKELGLTKDQGQWTMTIFLIGYALGIIPYGPLANRFGRKATLYFGISLAIIGDTVILFAGEAVFSLFLLGRFLSALGSAVGLKMAYTIVGDVYQHEKATKKISYFILSFAWLPALGMAVAGFLTESFGWESCFIFLIIYSVMLLFFVSFLPETNPKSDLEALNVKKIQAAYHAKLKNKKVVLSGLLMGTTTAYLFTFSTESPFIGIELLKLSPEAFGVLNLVPSIGLMLGAYFAHKLADFKEPITAMFWGILISLITACVMVLIFWLKIVNVWTLFIPTAFLYIGGSIVTTNAASLALSHAKDKSTASALMNFINIFLCIVAVFLLSVIPSNQPIVLPLFFLGIALISWCFKNLLNRNVSQAK